MINKIVMFIFSKTQVGKMLDGKKTIIGAVLVVLAAALEALKQLAPMFPQAPFLAEASSSLQALLGAVQPYLAELGVGFVAVGAVHKVAKAQAQKVQ